MSEGKDQRRFSREYKLAVIERMASGEPVSALSRELGGSAQVPVPMA